MMWDSHLSGTLELVRQLAETPATVRIWTERSFAPMAKQCGFEFADLYRDRSLEKADNISLLLAIRYVSFAATYAEHLIEEVRLWAPQLIIIEGFALIGRLVAERLNVPWVPVNANHLINDEDKRRIIRSEFPSLISPQCLEAVRRLREDYGLANASPYSFISDPSPWLNVHLEPEEWVAPDQRRKTQDIVFFGSLNAGTLQERKASRCRPGTMAVYASFGTVVARYWPEETFDALHSLALAVSRFSGARLTIGLGGAAVEPAKIAKLERLGAKVIHFADQLDELSSHNIFVTHHGLSSTHEAVARKIPMLSCPFVNDQPELAAMSQRFGLAVAAGADRSCLRVAPDSNMFAQKLTDVLGQYGEMQKNLEIARNWELRTIERRPQAARKVLQLF
jgi:UDP:flavonoid glycosyltransferase YjiC (YdhE family)